jgi:hypothetical protein
MFYVSAVLSLVFCLHAAMIALDKKKSILELVIPGLLLCICPMFVMPVFVVNFLALTLVAALIRMLAVHPKRYAFPCTIAVTALVYGVFCWRAVHEFDELRAEYAFKSLEDRLPVLPRAESRPPIPAVTDVRTAALERQAGDYGQRNFRSSALRRLHDDKVNLFITNQGFGVTRHMRVSEEDFIELPKGTGPIPQPVPRASPSGLPPGTSMPTANASEDPVSIHNESVLRFTNFNGFGYFKDRQHVAGFLPHRFDQVPDSAKERLKVETIDLVSLLRHAEPVAYVSADLPRMDELRRAPTRPLDAFELAGLTQIRAGEDLVSIEAESQLRMLGSIRNLKQCVDCHGGERGDLLGAFSYTLRRVGTATAGDGKQ